MSSVLSFSKTMTVNFLVSLISAGKVYFTEHTEMGIDLFFKINKDLWHKSTISTLRTTKNSVFGYFSLSVEYKDFT